MNKQPNIVFFFTDDQRFDTIAALGHPVIQTPNIDRLVSRGTTFTHAHIPCGTSGAVCMPSRAMLHSGRSLFHLQGAGQRIPEEHVTLGQALRQAGYRTFGTGKWHNGTAAFNRSFDEGSEIFFGGMMDHWNVPVCNRDPSGDYAARIPKCVDPLNSNKVQWQQADHMSPGRHSSEMVCDAGIEFIRSAAGTDTPFFAYIAFLAPHDPRVMPAAFHAMYDPATTVLPPNYAGGHPFDTGALHIRDEQLAGFPRTTEEVRTHIAEYYAMISHLDAELGRVLLTLEAEGVLDDTLIVFAGDNGLAVGQHGLMGKQNCYEHSVRVPLIFAGPGVPAGVRTEAYAYLYDLFPTLCALTGTDVPASVEGRSLVGLMNDTTRPGRDRLYFAYTDRQRAVKSRTHKLIEYAVPERERQTQLFNVVDDPWELTNLADDPAEAATLAALRADMVRLRDEWDDPASEWGQRFWARLQQEAWAAASAG